MDLLWICLVVPIFALFLWVSIKWNPSLALGIAIPLTWLVPVWCGIEIGPEKLNVRYAVAFLVLLSYPFLPKATFPWSLVPCDIAVLALFFTSLASDSLNDGFTFWAFIRSYSEWIIPYLLGRLAFQNRSSIEAIERVVVLVGLVLAIFAIIEAISGINLYEIVFGLRPEDQSNRDAMRWGFRRSYTVCMHPLYCGVFLTMFFGWAISKAWIGVKFGGNLFWITPVIVIAISTFATGSRGPFLATIAIVVVLILSLWAKKPSQVAIGLVVLFAIAFAFRSEILQGLDNWTGETRLYDRKAKVAIDEKEEKFSSARTRIFVFDLYQSALKRTGFLGYGSKAVAHFPVDVPGTTEERLGRKIVWTLDNEYLLITLRFGYLGLLAFLTIFLTSFYQCYQLKRLGAKKLPELFIQSQWVTIGAVALQLNLCWMSLDYGFFLFWIMGGISGIYREILVCKAKVLDPR